MLVWGYTYKLRGWVEKPQFHWDARLVLGPQRIHKYPKNIARLKLVQTPLDPELRFRVSG